LILQEIAALLSANRHLRIATSAPMGSTGRKKPTLSVDLDLDAHMRDLELEWRRGYEASIAARADYQTLAADPKASAAALDAARERLDRAEALKARIMAKIERLEDRMLSGD